MTNATQLHQLLLAKAKELSLPVAFKRDLEFHDLEALTHAADGTVFLWGIGECGTHMIRLDKHESPEYYIRGLASVPHWFILADGKLTEQPPVKPYAPIIRGGVVIVPGE